MIIPPKPITLEELKATPAQPPTITLWSGISHPVLIEEIQRKLGKLGWETIIEGIHLSQDQATCWVSFSLTVPCLRVPNEYRAGFCVRHRPIKGKAIRGYIGLLGEGYGIPLFRNHMGSYTRKTLYYGDVLDLKFSDSVLTKQLDNLYPTVKGLESIKLSWDKVNAYLMQAGRDGLISWSRVGLVDTLYRQEGVGSAWSLIDAYCRVNRMTGPNHQIAGALAFIKMLSGK